MLYKLFSFLFYLIVLIGIPLVSILFGGLLDHENRSYGNVKNDLPSTICFIISLIIDLYIMFDPIIMFVSLLLLMFNIIGYLISIYISYYFEYKIEQIRLIILPISLFIGLLIADFIVG